MHMSGGRLPKRTVIGNIGVEGGEDRVGRIKKVQWTDVQSEFRAFGITGDWEVTALEAGVWVETVTDGRRRFIAARGKKKVQYSTIDAARHHNEKKEATPRDWINQCSTPKGITCEATPIHFVYEPKEPSRAGARRTKT